MDEKVYEMRVGNFRSFWRAHRPFLHRMTCGIAMVPFATVLALLLFQCQHKNLAHPSASSPTTAQVIKQLGKDYHTSYNASHTYVILSEKQDAAATGTNIHFVVMRMTDSVIVHEGSYLRGYTKWIDDTTIEKMNAPGKVPPDQDLSAYRQVIYVEHPLPKY